jgi:SH3-like domain-containing protein
MLVTPQAQAQDKAPQETSRRVITQPVPNAQASLRNLHRVVAAKTPSGFEVPRYVSLKFGKTNGRSGPSTKHPIVWQYRRAGLPVIVVAETENWRKIRDIRGDEAWIYKAGLSGERSVITLTDAPVYKRASEDTVVLAVAEKGALLRLETCEDALCKVFSKDGQRGWVEKDTLWGAAPLF